MKHFKTTHALIFSLLFTLFAAGSTYAQAPTPKDVFTTDLPITYLGIDFSNSKLIGDTAISLVDLPNKFESINNVAVNEPKKYDIGNALKKTHVTNDLTAVKEQNARIDSSKFLSSNDADYTRFKEADIARIVSKYNFKGKTGVGWYLLQKGSANEHQKLPCM